MKKLFVLIIIAAVAVIVAACSAPALSELSIEGGIVKIDAPKGWNVTDPKTEMKGNGHIISPDGKASIEVITISLASEVTDEYLESTYDTFSSGLLFNAQILNTQSVSAGGRDGKQYEATMPQDSHCLLTVFLTEENAFLILCTSPESEFESYKDTFLNAIESISFK